MSAVVDSDGVKANASSDKYANVEVLQSEGRRVDSMRKLVRRMVSLCLFAIVGCAMTQRLTVCCRAQALATSTEGTPGLTSPPSTLQLEFRVPFAPTMFPSGNHSYAVYEIYFTNFSPKSLALTRVEVVNADTPSATPLAVFDGDRLKAMIRILGGNTDSDTKGGVVLGGGQSAIAFMWVAIDSGTIPKRLLHRVVTSNGESVGALVTTQNTRLQVLGAPLQGQDWLAADGPSNDEDNHHRRGVYVYAGEAIDSRRYAIDWKQVRGGASFSGDARDLRSYLAYGSDVLAVANARVVAIKDGIPQNVPGHGQDFHPAVPITYDTAHGNLIILDLGGGQFAHYHHLQPGSLLVKPGDYVRRGQIIARVGDSGDAREPHLHFEVTTSATEGMGEGVPYLIDRYRIENPAKGTEEVRANQLPLDGSIVDFGMTNKQRHK